MSSYPRELWTWSNCKDAITSLPGRLGFPQGDKLQVLGFELSVSTGSIHDAILGQTLDESQRNERLTSNTLFYVLSAYSESREKPPTGKLISSKQFRGVRFTMRDTMGERYRVARHFKDPSELEATAKNVGGSTVDFPHGDIAVSLYVLPFIPITIVLTVDDGEFPADTRIFYDETVENYLDAEQTYFLTNLTVSRLVQISRQE